MASREGAAVAVVQDQEGLAALLSPLRRKLLNQLHSEPDSATGLGRKMGLTRQKVNYHLRKLERAGLLEAAGEIPRRGCTEKQFRPAAQAYLVSPDLAGELGTDPAGLRDRFSSAYLVALGARLVRDVADLRRGADAAGQRLATLAIELDVRFGSADQRHAFAEELAETLARLAARYQSSSPQSRAYRFVVGGHPVVKKRSEKQEGGEE